MDSPRARILSALQALGGDRECRTRGALRNVVGAQTETLQTELQEARAWNEALRAELEDAHERRRIRRSPARSRLDAV